ncbi:MAG: MFS transporter [Myxococcales bacterium]|nr:MFS transporter [Myxococcales bacterium]
MMVMPLGPDFARQLGISTSHIGYVGGAYTAAAAVSGLVGALFLDRVDRRSALVLSMLGLALGTAAGAFARGLPSLMLARVLAGAFGGPATSVSLSIVADVVPPQRRGKAMGWVMSAFSVASVLGVPAGLELARRGTFRTPFLAVAGLGLAVTVFAFALLPSMRGHLAERRAQPAFAEIFARPLVRRSLALTAMLNVAGFVLIPNIAGYVQLNLGYPRARLGLLYLCGGVASFLTLRVTGRLVDQRGSTWVARNATILLAFTIVAGFVVNPPWLPVTILFILFMTAMSARNVSASTLTSLVPRADERARFTSMQSSVQHLAAASGAFLSAQVLSARPDGQLVGMARVATMSVLLTITLPLLFLAVEREARA